MINHRDVRIGNLVMYESQEFKIYTIDKEYPTLETIEFGVGVLGWNDLDPIPLTEEWLKKLGFHYIESGIIYWLPMTNLKTELHIEWYPSGSVAVIESDFCKLILDEIKYVHSLQNLYFALTGMELICKSDQ